MPSQISAVYQIPRLYLAWSIVKAKGSVGGIRGHWHKDELQRVLVHADGFAVSEYVQ